MNNLRDIEASQEAEKIRNTSHLLRIREEILALAKLTKRNQQDLQKWDSAQAARLTSLRTKFEALQKEQAICTFQIETLKSLHFPEIRRRWYQIKKADQRSDQWIFDQRKTTFVTWLQSHRSDDGLFYISGRVCFSSHELR